MKKLFIAIALLTSTCLTACQKMKSETAINSFMSTNSDEQLNQLDATAVEYMINNNFNFNLLLYTESCSVCEKALESVKEEQSRTHLLIFKIEMDAVTIKYLTDALPSLFKTDDIYPAMYLFSEGKISYTIPYNKLTDYKTLHRVLYPQVRETKNHILTNDLYFDYLFNEATTALVYTYDSSMTIKGDEIGCKAFDTVNKSHDYFGVFIDKNSAKTALISKFYTYFDFTEDEQFDYLFTIKNGQIKTTVRYLSSDGNEINNLLNSIL